jgi:thiol:disulfide interchange protein DsbC
VSARFPRLCACLGSLLVTGAAPAEQTAPLDAERVNEVVPGVNIRSVQPVPIEGGLYEVIDDQNNVFYLDGAARIGFQCELFDVGTRRNLTQESVARYRAVQFSALPLEFAIKRVKGDGRRRLAVFADPDCPFCMKLEHELENVDDVTVYTFLYPIPDLHPDAVERSRRIWCSADRDAAWRDWLLAQRDAPAAPAGCESPAGNIAAIAPHFWINGTPTLVFDSGRVVHGTVPRDALESYLVEAPLAAPAAPGASGGS